MHITGNEIPLLDQSINCVSTRLDPLILYIKEKYTLCFGNILLIGLSNSSTDYWLDVVVSLFLSFLTDSKSKNYLNKFSLIYVI